MASNSSDSPPDHLGATVPTGGIEKAEHHDDGISPTNEKHETLAAEEDEEEEEDIDALIDDLESQDGHADEEEEEENAPSGSGRVVPEESEFN